MENNTVFVLIAGGKSERMGFPKGLLKYEDTFWILEQLNRISKTTITEVFIGLGYDYRKYFEAIPWLKNAQQNFISYQNLKIKVIVNTKPELGSFSTLQTVLKKVEPLKNILFNHIDIPLLNSKELNLLISTENDIVFPNYEGKNGHPIKMSSSFWNELTKLDLNDENTRLDYQIKKINPAKISTIEVSDRIVLYNLNTKSDWDSYLNEIL